MTIPTTISNSNSNQVQQDKITSEFKLSFELTTNILLDSGSELSLIDVDYCNDYNIPYFGNDNLPNIIGIGGRQS